MDEEDVLTVLTVLLAIAVFGLVGWVLFELGLFLHGLNGW